MNLRLTKFLESNNILSEVQNGFRKGRYCEDHIFVLHSVLRTQLQKKRQAFCCFVDFSSAFDVANRDLIVHALKSLGTDIHFLAMIKLFYQGTISAVKITNNTTDWFQTYSRVRQGQNDSATLFSILLNSLAHEIQAKNAGIWVSDTNISILIYADDILLIAESEDNLQCMLNVLDKWCKKWRMIINMDKTQIIRFRPKCIKCSQTKFKLGTTNEDLVMQHTPSYMIHV